MSQNHQDADKKTALVLSGGGVKCAFQAGALEVLNEAGFRYNAVSGVSGGALNGAMLATNQIDQLLDVWGGITPEKVLKKRSLLSIAGSYLFYKIGLGEPPVSRFSNAPLFSLMKEQFLGKQATLPFHFGYVKMESGIYVNATINRTNSHRIDETDIKRILASTAIPVYFNPIYLGNDTCVDGGLRNISPIKEVLSYKPDRIVIIPTEPLGGTPESENVRDILEIAFRTIEIMLNEIFNEDIDRFLKMNQLVRQAESEGCTLTKTDGTPYKYFEPLLIAPQKSLGDPLDFSNNRIQNLMEIGRQRATQILRGNES